MIKYTEPFEWKTFEELKREHAEMLLLIKDIVYGEDDTLSGGYLIAEADSYPDNALTELSKQCKDKGENVTLIEFSDIVDRMMGAFPFSYDPELVYDSTTVMVEEVLQSMFYDVHAVYEPEGHGYLGDCYCAAVDLFKPGITFKVWFKIENGKIDVKDVERWIFG